MIHESQIECARRTSISPENSPMARRSSFCRLESSTQQNIEWIRPEQSALTQRIAFGNDAPTSASGSISGQAIVMRNEEGYDLGRRDIVGVARPTDVAEDNLGINWLRSHWRPGNP